MASSSDDAFTFIDRTLDGGHHDGRPHMFDKWTDLTSAKAIDPFLQLLAALRAEYPDYVVTYSIPGNVNLAGFAAAGHASMELDTETESIMRLRVWLQPKRRGDGTGHLADQVAFAKYRYHWANEHYMLLTVQLGYNSAQFVLKELAQDETQLSNSAATDALFTAVGHWQDTVQKGIWVFDANTGWILDRNLYKQVQKASWDKVILEPSMKTELQRVSTRFFDGQDIYEDLGVPWKRGLIFYGPAGNGKTISIKALMHTLADRADPIPTLYVKSAPQTYHIRSVFMKARQSSPCLLVLEDIDTIVTAATRSYFFNEVDGLENNDGILMIASTNHIDRLDPGLSKRPSRFDRKYLFPQPSEGERVQYVRFWRAKLAGNPAVEFPELLVGPIAEITHGFSFAYMQEAFVATLLEMVHRQDGDDDLEMGRGGGGGGGDDDDKSKYLLWRIIKHQVEVLRQEMDEKMALSPPANAPLTQVPTAPLLAFADLALDPEPQMEWW